MDASTLEQTDHHTEDSGVTDELRNEGGVVLTALPRKCDELIGGQGLLSEVLLTNDWLKP